LKLDTPVGPIEYRAIDHQSTMGAYVGTLAIKDGQGIMTDFRYVDGATVQPDDAQVKQWRPADRR
jgi:branched-chain amino acid transport system substrate-binding protein